jgi:hypothetical protein
MPRRSAPGTVVPMETLTAPAPTHGRAAATLSIVTAVVALVLIALAGAIALDTSRTEGSLAGLGYIVAIVVAAPAVVALLLSVPAFVLRRRTAALAVTLGWFGLAAALLPVLLFVWFTV